MVAQVISPSYSLEDWDKFAKSGDFERAKSAATVFTDITKGVPITDILEHVGDIWKVGWVVKMYISFLGLPKKEDPVIGALKALSKQIEELSIHIDDNFKDLKAFGTELNFYNEVNKSFKLFEYMKDALEDPSDSNSDDFEKQYKKNSPTDYAYTAMGLLNKATTNPLKMAMDADPMRKTETYQKWRTAFNGVFAQLLVIEHFANGIFGKEINEKTEKLDRKVQEYEKIMNGWEEEYKKSFWSSGAVKRLIEETQNKSLSNGEKAKKIKEQLEKALTDDSFYIIVYKSGEGSFYSEKSSGQVFQSLNRNDCSVMVARSVTGRNVDQKTQDYMKETVDGYYNNTFGMFSGLYLTSFMGPAGTVCLVRDDFNPVVEYANCNRGDGPGYWIRNTTVYISVKVLPYVPSPIPVPVRFWLIVGHP